MKTFNEEKKKEVLKIALEHQEADRFIQGEWIKEDSKINGFFKGCFFGCMTQTSDNTLEEASNQLQIPLWLVHVSENIFEGLESKDSLTFPVELLKAIPCNNDLDKVWRKWNKSVLTDQLSFVEKNSEQEKAINQCIDLFNMDKITESAMSAARSASRSAARSASRSAARSALRSASRSAAWSADSAAWSADSAAWSAESAARSADSASMSAAMSAARSARSAARSEYYKFLKELLIKILRENG